MATTYEPIATTTLGSATDTVIFSSIPSTYTDLRLVGVIKLSGGDKISFGFNGDAPFGTSNYSFTYLSGNGSATESITRTGWNGIEPAPNWGNTYPALITADIFSYTGSTYKTTLTTASTDANGSGVTRVTVGMWRSTAAINTITIKTPVSTMAANTIFTLYGIKAA